MDPVTQYYRICAEKLIPELEKRQMEAAYFENSGKLIEYLKKLIPEKAVVAWGGSVTLQQAGVFDFLRSGKFNVLDRETAANPAELKEIFRKSFFSDFYFMSANSISMDGKLVNIDGNGNRAAALIYGPENVIVVAGMNKIVKDEKTALERVKNFAAPVNAVRLSRPTPCSAKGVCIDCLSDGCICSHTVITRRSGIKGRIKVFLVGENLGF